MKVVVGSLNPVKINATKNTFSKFFDNVEVVGLDIDSKVSHMPLTRQETRKGAINRAKKAVMSADYGVGLEGGVHENEHGMFLFGIAAIMDKNGKLGLSSSEGFMIPEIVARRVRKGEELGPVMDTVSNINNIKQKGGAIGFFTKNTKTRTQSFEDALTLALVRFINKELYE